MDLDGLGLLMLRDNPVNIYREDSVFAVGSGDLPIFGERESSAELAASDSSMLKLFIFSLWRFTIRSNFQNLIVLRMGVNSNLDIIFLVPRYCKLDGCVFLVMPHNIVRREVCVSIQLLFDVIDMIPKRFYTQHIFLLM